MKLGPTARLFALVTPFALVGPSAAVHADEEMDAIRDVSSCCDASRASFDGSGESDDGSFSKLSTEDEARAKASAKKKRSETNPDKKKARAAGKDSEKTTVEKKDSPNNGSTASKKTDASAGSKKAPEPKPLPGKTIDFAYDAKDVKVPSRAYMGRVFVHDRVVDSKKPLPLVVFIHGLNKALLKYRWMGGGDEGDVRRIVADLIDDGKIPPVLLAAPSSIQPDAVSHDASFPVFDFDQFLELTEKSLEGVAVVDRTRIIVAGHSGAGCSSGGGIVAAVRAKSIPHTVISIDTCMGGDLAKTLGKAPATTNIVVTWQTASWDRSFGAFTTTFRDTLSENPAAEGVLRELEALPALPRAHDATVAQTFGKYLPQLLQ